MKSMEAIRSTVRSSLTECDSHLRVMERAFSGIRNHLPIRSGDFPPSDERLVSLIDQFLFRFIKMQDSMAKRLCPSVYQLLENDPEPRAFLDVLNRLEQLEVLSSVETWQFFRDLRNNLAHDYPESRDQNIRNLNLLFERWPEFAGMYRTVRDGVGGRMGGE